MTRFVLVDCNNFFVSCERIFNPKLETAPVIVLSNNDGCAVARSQEAKRLGIKMGDPYFKIKDFCKNYNVTVYSANFELYGDISQRVMTILSERAPEIQIYSIDEAFLLYPPEIPTDELFAYCAETRRILKQWVGIPTCIGIAPTKTLAKLANDIAKKDRLKGISDLTSYDAQEEALKRFPIGDVWGIGKASKTKLSTQGIQTAWQFREMDPLFVRQKMGVVGERMLWELRGLSCLPLEDSAPKKSITCSRSFGHPVTSASDLAEALSTHVSSACTKLRAQESCARSVYVYLEECLNAQTGLRLPHSTVVPFQMPSNDTAEIITTVKNCLPRIFQEGKRYKKCGIVLMDLVAESSVMPDLFFGRIDPKRRRLAQTVDAVNEHFGKNTLFYAAMGVDPTWKMRSDNRTRRYTTCWEELAIVKG